MIDPNLQSKWELAVILIRRRRPILIPKDAPFFEHSGERFEDVGLGQHNGFYDFLRTRTGAVIGVRYLPTIEVASLLRPSPEDIGFKYVSDGKLQTLLITWSSEVDFDANTSSDQYFGNNILYHANHSRTLALGFALDPLSPPELASL